MPALRKQQVHVQPLAYSDGGSPRREIPRTHWMRKIRCAIAGDVVISGGSSSGTPVTGAIRDALLSGIRFESKPSEYRGSPLDVPVPVWFYNTYRTRPKGATPRLLDVSSGDAATYPVVCEFDLPIAYVGGHRNAELASQVFGPGLTQADIVAEWAASEAGLITGGDRAIDASAVELRMALIGDEDERLGRAVAVRHDYRREPVTAVGKQLIHLPAVRGERLLYALVVAHQSSAPSNALLGSNNIKLKLNGTTLIEEDVRELQRQNAADCGVDSANWPTGVYFLDQDQDGDAELRDAYELERDSQRHTIELDVEATPSSAFVDILAVWAKTASKTTE